MRPEAKGGVARLLFTSFLFMILFIFLPIIPGPTAQVTTWTVTNGNDSGPGSLREAIENGYYYISFDPGVTAVTLTSASLSISHGLTITGPVRIIRSGDVKFRIFNVDSGGLGIAVSMFHVTVENGHSVDLTAGGGGLYIGYADTAYLYDCVFQNNHTRDGVSGSNNGADGGAIYNAGELSMLGCTIQSNSTGAGAVSAAGSIGGSGGRGGGIYNQGTMHLDACTIAHNTTGDGESKTAIGTVAGNGGDGAGIFSAFGNVEIKESTISDNVTGNGGTGTSYGGNGGSGGGIYYNYGAEPVTINLVTISGNATGQGGDAISGHGGNGGDGGGIYNQMSGAHLAITFCTITDNSLGEKGTSGSDGSMDGENGHGGGIYRETGTTTLWYTILAQNGLLADDADGPDCHSGDGNINSDGYNLIGIERSEHAAAPCSFTGRTYTDIVNQDPKLGPLQQSDPLGYGDITDTHALKYGSPCIDAGETSVDVPGLNNIDQRSVERPQNGRVDIGAFEAIHYTIAGQVEDGYAQPLADVEMQGLPNNPLTDIQGAYTVTLPEGWDGTVTPVKTEYYFVPDHITYDGLTGDMLEEDYIAYYETTTYTISGFVRTADEEGVSGVVLNGLPGSPATVTDGAYSASVEGGWSGVVTPEKEGYTFDPAWKTYDNVQADQTGEDYVASVIQGEIISGRITLTDETPVSGVALHGYPLFDQVDTTDTNGEYEVILPDGYIGKMSPYKAGYRFTPSFVDIDLTGGGVAAVKEALNQDFTAEPVTAGTAPQPVAAGTLQKDYVMSVLGVHPLTPTAVGVFGIPAAEYDKTQIRIGRWNPVTAVYDEYPLTGETDILPGWTTWVISRDARTFEVQGYKPDTIPGPTGNGVYFPVKAGWNQVGNPFDHGVAMDKVRFVNQSTEMDVIFWVWNNADEDYLTINSGGVLPGRQGGWINAPTSGWIFLEATAVTSGTRSSQNLVSAPADAQRPPDPPGQLESGSSGGLKEGDGGGCFIQVLFGEVE